MRLRAEFLPDVDDDGFEAAVGGGVKDACFEVWRRADGLEADLDFGGGG